MRLAASVSAIVLILLVLRYGRDEILVNVSPLARVVVNERVSKLNPAAPVPRRFLDVLADGFVDDQYISETPIDDGVSTVVLEFPWTVRVDRILVVGWSGGGSGILEITAFRNSVVVWSRPAVDWSSVAGKPPIVSLADVGVVDSFEFAFRGAGPADFNSTQCYVRCERWEAWSWFLGLQVVVPWLVGGLWALALFGWGDLLGRTAMNTGNDLGRTLLLGVCATAILSALWLLLPPSWTEGVKAVLPTAALLAPALRTLGRRPTIEQRRFLIVLSAAALLLVAITAVESTIVANRRVKPMDHLFGLMTAQHLLEGHAVPDEMVLRPWLVPALSVPTEAIFGRFSYWIYLGQMAWINVLGLAVIASAAERWGIPRVFAVAMLSLSPLTVAFHFPGQRVLVAGLCLLAVDEWTRQRGENWWGWGGLAAAAAVMAHPGALFILPPAAIYFLFRRPSRVAVLGLASVGIAGGGYLIWTQVISIAYPTVKNNLVYYPFMRTLDDPLPGRNLREILASMSAERWSELALNRVKQLRHYVWADNPWQHAVFERLKAVSLTSTLGVALTILAFVNLRRFGRVSVLWIGMVGPLLFFHLHIGQAFPQFHILPQPFFTFALVGISALQRFGKWATKLVVAEAMLHHSFVPMLVLIRAAGKFELPGWFVGDPAAQFLSLIPLAPWAVLAAMALGAAKTEVET